MRMNTISNIDNDDALQSVILRDLSDIIDEVADLLLTNLRDSIKENVYDKGSPTTYIRQGINGGLEGSFNASNAEVLGLAVQSAISQDPSLQEPPMAYDPENFVHGSVVGGIVSDVRDILAELIINGRNGSPHVGDLFGEGFWREPRDFWQPFINELDKNGNQYIEDAFRARGIQYTIF
jgi:hypothetical protein